MKITRQNCLLTWLFRTFLTSPLMLFFVQLLSGNFIINCRANLKIHTDFWSKLCLLYWMASNLPRLLDTASKFALFSVSGFKDENFIKSKPTWKLKHANPILEYLEYFCQISAKLILIIFSYTVSKLVHFLIHSVDLIYTTWLIIIGEGFDFLTRSCMNHKKTTTDDI